MYRYFCHNAQRHDVMPIRTALQYERLKLTRKLSYRKDDRAMRPIYGCPENFRESLSTPTATFPRILMGISSDLSYECAYKIRSSYSFTRSWDDRGTQEIGGSLWIRPRSLFSNILMDFFPMDPVNVPVKFEVRSFIRSWDNSDCSFGVGLWTSNLGEGEAIRGRNGTVRRSVGDFL